MLVPGLNVQSDSQKKQPRSQKDYGRNYRLNNYKQSTYSLVLCVPFPFN